MINNSILSALPFESLRVTSHFYPTILLSAGITTPMPIIPCRAFGALERIGWRVHPRSVFVDIFAVFRGVRGNFINRLHFYTLHFFISWNGDFIPHPLFPLLLLPCLVLLRALYQQNIEILRPYRLHNAHSCK